MLLTANARVEREAAQRAADAIGLSLERISEAKVRTEQSYPTGLGTAHG